jgi:hypothetical protein
MIWAILISLISGVVLGMFVESYIERVERAESFDYEPTPIGDALAREYLTRDN